MNKKIYVLEYSFEQKTYHIDTLEDIISKNKEMFKKGITNGYIPIEYSDDIDILYSILEIYKKIEV